MNLKDCWVCGHECETDERLSFDVRCEDCQREGDLMEDENKIRWMNGNEKERKEIA